MLTVRLPISTPPVPTEQVFDVVISQMVGIPATGTTVRSKPTGGSEWQVVILAEALAARGLSVAIVGPFFAYAFDRGVQYIPAGELVGRRDSQGTQRPTAKVSTKVLVSQRFGPLPPGIEFQRLVVELHDIPDARLAGVMNLLHDVPDGRVVVHSEFAASLLDGWPRVSVIPCMLPDEFYQTPMTCNAKAPQSAIGQGAATQPSPRFGERRRYVYGSAAMKGLEPTLALWKQIKQAKVAHFKKATLTITSPGYDQINPEWLKDAKDVEVVTGLSPAGMQELLAASDGIFMVSTFPETFGIVFHQSEVARKPAWVLQLHKAHDALLETLCCRGTLHDNADQFVNAVAHDTIAQIIESNDYRVSTVLPQWLDVLGLTETKEKAA